MTWSACLLLPLGLLAGLLSGLLGIGGGLIFSPVLLAIGLPAHAALATSTLAIVPTTLAGSWTHLRSQQLPSAAVAAIVGGAVSGGLLFSRSGQALPGWLLLALQAGLYGALVLIVGPSQPEPSEPAEAAEGQAAASTPHGKLVLVGLVAGAASGWLGIGGGLVMVPLMVRSLKLRVRLAIRLSTLAVCASALSASVYLVHDGRTRVLPALLLGGSAALAARWSAARLQRVPEHWLVGLLKLLCGLLALDSSRRALALLMAQR